MIYMMTSAVYRLKRMSCGGISDCFSEGDFLRVSVTVFTGLTIHQCMAVYKDIVSVNIYL